MHLGCCAPRGAAELTALTAAFPLPPAGGLARHLPASLQALQLGIGFDFYYYMDGSSPSAAEHTWLGLHRLRALTSLDVRHGVRVSGGALPAPLRRLSVGELSSAEPLLALEPLATLHAKSCTAAADELRQLGALRQRSAVALSFPRERHHMAAASGGLGVLPLVQLSLHRQTLSSSCMAHLGTCTRLTRLEMNGPSLADGATLDGLACLSRLTALELWLELDEARPLSGNVDGIVAALTALPGLRQCCLLDVPLGPAAAALTSHRDSMTSVEAPRPACMATGSASHRPPVTHHSSQLV